MSDVNGGNYPNPNGSSVFPGTQFTGPITAGNIVHSDGSGVLANLGETAVGTANVGYVVMAQSAVVTQASGATSIVIPAQSQIVNIIAMVTTVFTGSATTFEVGATAGTTAASAFSPSTEAGGTAGQVLIKPSTAAQIANWDNVSNATFQTGGPQDVEILVTPANTGSGVMTLTVEYLQGINLSS